MNVGQEVHGPDDGSFRLAQHVSQQRGCQGLGASMSESVSLSSGRFAEAVKKDSSNGFNFFAEPLRTLPLTTPSLGMLAFCQSDYVF